LNSFCKENNSVVLIRPHKYWENISEEKGIRNYIQKGSFSNIRYLPFDLFQDAESLVFISNILVTDWSSIYSDFMLNPKNKETIFLDVPAPFPGGFVLGPEDRAGFLAKDEKDFFDKLKMSLSGKKSNPVVKKRAIEKMYGKNAKYADGHATERCVKEILKLI